MSTQESLWLTKDRVTAITNGLTTVSSRVGGSRTSSMVLAYTLAHSRPQQNLEYGRWANVSSGSLSRSARVSEMGSLTTQHSFLCSTFNLTTPTRTYPSNSYWPNTDKSIAKDCGDCRNIWLGARQINRRNKTLSVCSRLFAKTVVVFFSTAL